MVCGSNMRQLTNAGNMWLTETRRDRSPGHTGWAAFALKNMGGQTGCFGCPSDQDPSLVPAVYMTQSGPANAMDPCPSISMDAAYIRRTVTYSRTGSIYRCDIETEAALVGGGDADYNDCSVFYRPLSKGSSTCTVWATKGSTGRKLGLVLWSGRYLCPIEGTTEQFSAPALWGSYGMNLSAALPGSKQRQMLYVEYEDWTAVVEPELRIAATDGSGVRNDDPAKMVPNRHNNRVNVGFLDSHVERIPKARLYRPTLDRPNPLWHPLRPAGWVPPVLY